MKRSKILCFALFIALGWSTTKVEAQTFNDRRVISAHSVEMLPKRKLDMRIAHRFGDMFGDAGGWPSFYGLENAADVLIGFEYGLANNFNIGLNRTKGAGPLNKFVNGTAKLRLWDQFGKREAAISVVVLSAASVSTMQNSTNPEALSNFKKSGHRWVTTQQVIFGRKFSHAFSLQALASLTHRNQVNENDDNDLFSVGLAGRIKLSKVYGLIFDANVPISDLRTSENGYYPAIGFGLEIETGGGHVFQINLSNSKGLSMNDYIPYTQSNWMDGEFRLGFTISRLFNL